MVGVKSLMAEATYFSMCKEIFEKLDLDIVIQYNNRKLSWALHALLRRYALYLAFNVFLKAK